MNERVFMAKISGKKHSGICKLSKWLTGKIKGNHAYHYEIAILMYKI
jgi:hypothetical protein